MIYSQFNHCYVGVQEVGAAAPSLQMCRLNQIAYSAVWWRLGWGLCSLQYMFQELRIRLLMQFPIFIGRNSDAWPQRLSPPHVQSLNFCWTARYLPSRGSVLPFHGSWSGSFNTQVVHLSSKEALWLLPSGRDAPPQWIALPCRGMNIVSVWFLPCRLYQALVLLICCLLSSHQAGFSWSQLNCQVFKECWEGSSVPKVLQLLIGYLSRIAFMDTIHLALDLSIYDYCLHVSFFWISMLCRVYNPEPGFFLTYSPPDSHLFPWGHHHVFKFRSRIPKMDLFCMGCFVQFGLGKGTSVCWPVVSAPEWPAAESHASDWLATADSISSSDYRQFFQS